MKSTKPSWRAGQVIEAFHAGASMCALAQRFHVKKEIVEEICRAYAIGQRDGLRAGKQCR